MAIKVILTDDHLMVLSGLEASLINKDNIEVLAAYSSGTALMEGLATLQPDVVLLDLQMPDISGMELVAKILVQWPSISIIILTGHEDIYYAIEMLNIGCRGYLLKGSTSSTMLTEAIERVFEGMLFVAPSLKDKLLYDVMKIKKVGSPGIPKLTRREAEVLKYISGGLSSAQIAEQFCLSIRTVESHRLSVLKKLQVNNTTSLLKKAKDYGLL